MKKRTKPNPKQAEDRKDYLLIRKSGRKPTYSWNEFMKELGYHDLVTPSRKRR